MGIVTALGCGSRSTCEALLENRSGIRALTLFPTVSNTRFRWEKPPSMAAQVIFPAPISSPFWLPSRQWPMRINAPDAVIMGTTTGGLLATEQLLKENALNPELYRRHATGSVAQEIARVYECRGPALTVSTACSSGAAALKLALEMLRSGKAQRVLAGGADSLCRLTYHGFNALQLIDPDGARPLDEGRQGYVGCRGCGAATVGGR